MSDRHSRNLSTERRKSITLRRPKNLRPGEHPIIHIGLPPSVCHACGLGIRFGPAYRSVCFISYSYHRCLWTPSYLASKWSPLLLPPLFSSSLLPSIRSKPPVIKYGNCAGSPKTDQYSALIQGRKEIGTESSAFTKMGLDLGILNHQARVRLLDKEA